VNDNESVWGGHNTVEEISAMRGIFPVALRAAQILRVDQELQRRWQEVIGALSPVPVRADSAGRPARWKRSLAPVVYGNADALPDPNTMPPWFFDLCNLEAEERIRRLANDTYDGYFPDGIRSGAVLNVLSKLAVAGSLLGRVESTRYLIPGQINTAEVGVMRNRMDLREGPQTTSIQRLGRAAEALQLALCQSVPPAPGEDPVIRVFPAWPVEWDAQFQLACRGGFIVTASIDEQQIRFVEVHSRMGVDCRIQNPWPDKRVKLFRNGKLWKSVSGESFSFSTNAGDVFRLISAEDNPGNVPIRIPSARP